MEGYAAIGGGSPLRKITVEQGEALQRALGAKDLPAKVYVGMRYWHPFTEEAIEEIKRDGVNRLVVLPLYPQFSITTSGSSLRLLERIFRDDEYLVNMQHTVIPSWYQRTGYVEAMTELIAREMGRMPSPEEVSTACSPPHTLAISFKLCLSVLPVQKYMRHSAHHSLFSFLLSLFLSVQAHVFFSAHGVPKTYVEDAGDPYKAEMEECIDLIMAELRRRGYQNPHTLAYQSRVGPVEWLKPYTDVTIEELGKSGVKSLLAVPIR